MTKQKQDEKASWMNMIDKAMQMKFEAGQKAERERILKIIKEMFPNDKAFETDEWYTERTNTLKELISLIQENT